MSKNSKKILSILLVILIGFFMFGCIEKEVEKIIEDIDNSGDTPTTRGNYRDIEVQEVSNGGTYAYGNVYWGASKTVTFTIQNLGDIDLEITGNITTSTTNVFTVTQPSTTTITPGSSVTFNVKYTPNGINSHSTIISIPSNDPCENPYTFTITANGVYDPNVTMSVIPVEWDFIIYSDTPGYTGSKSFSIKNTGNNILGLTNNPKVTIQVILGNKHCFYVSSQPSKTYLQPNETTTFTITFSTTDWAIETANAKIIYNINKTKIIPLKGGYVEEWMKP